MVTRRPNPVNSAGREAVITVAGRCSGVTEGGIGADGRERERKKETSVVEAD